MLVSYTTKWLAWAALEAITPLLANINSVRDATSLLVDLLEDLFGRNISRDKLKNWIMQQEKENVARIHC